MNNITLCFQSKTLECKYQKQATEIYNQIFSKILICYVAIVGVSSLIVSISIQNLSGIISSLVAIRRLFNLLNYKEIFKKTKYLNQYSKLHKLNFGLFAIFSVVKRSAYRRQILPFLYRMNQNIKFEEIEEDSKTNFRQYNNISDSYIDECGQSKNSLATSKIIIQYELLQGELELANVFKVTVKDYGIGMSIEKILNMLQIINNKNTDFSAEYKNNRFLGWKVNYHIIGNLGPFYNFFVKSQQNRGFEYHFYIFQDITVLKENQITQKIVFKNSQFEISLEKSNKYYQNINKIKNQKIQF
ncbi:hypothetical protein ABPG72_005684 [Tetrahymena utriculariae]